MRLYDTAHAPPVQQCTCPRGPTTAADGHRWKQAESPARGGALHGPAAPDAAPL